ncbi:Putative nuclease [Frankliniella fusca]|uniref:Putative nuclease HARBI1 n=1 Tax=Frankliniella fusca TaxID=407009 RepID=A0AAE1LI16_9NEOP|nr:Putative nuclease [Frankliniella fusca]
MNRRQRSCLALQSFLTLDDSDSEDDAPARRPRLIKERMLHFDDLDDVAFMKRFRLSKEGALYVLEKIAIKLEFRSFEKNQSVAPVNQLLLCLRFYATGCTQLSAGDFCGVSESTANRIVLRVSDALASLYKEHISFPDDEASLKRTQLEFHKIARFPKVIGAVDCTHVKIKSPGGEQAEYYRCRKGYFSLNCQAICNANMEILDMVARWPGSTHDQTIFDQCRQRALLENDRYGDVYLLGDGGYACRKYIMTPLAECRTPAENLYNEAQIRTRNPVERLFGIWKGRFPVLALGLNVDLKNVEPIIIATAVLHNILRRRGEAEPPDDDELNLPMPWDRLIDFGQIELVNHPTATEDNNLHRRAIINDYFRSLQHVHQ